MGRALSQLTHGNLVNCGNLMNVMLSPNLQTKLRWEDGLGHMSQSMWTREHGDNWQVPGNMWQWEGNLLPQNKCPELGCRLLLKLLFFSTAGVKGNMIAIEQVRVEEASFKSFLLRFSLQVPNETIRRGWLLAGQVFLNTSTPSVHFQYTIISFPLSHGGPSVSWHGSPWAQQLEVRDLLQDWWRRIFHLPLAEVFACILCSVSY